MNLDPAIVFFTLGSLLVLCLGILFAFSPRRFVRFGEWWGSLVGLKPSNVEWKQGPALNWRLIGVYLICIGLLFLMFLVKNFYIRSGMSSSPMVTHPNPPDAEGVRRSTGEILLLLDRVQNVDPNRIFVGRNLHVAESDVAIGHAQPDRHCRVYDIVDGRAASKGDAGIWPFQLGPAIAVHGQRRGRQPACTRLNTALSLCGCSAASEVSVRRTCSRSRGTGEYRRAC